MNPTIMATRPTPGANPWKNHAASAVTQSPSAVMPSTCASSECVGMAGAKGAPYWFCG